MKLRKKNQRKWESNYHQVPEEYSNSKKEKEFLSKYRHIAGEYLEDWEFIELFKKNNYDEELISKESTYTKTRCNDVCIFPTLRSVPS